MTTYRERREARAERLHEWAAKREAKAEAAEEQARSMGAMIPFGQPILAGHHSEGRDRRYRDRIASTYERGFQHARKADEMEGKASNIEAQLATSIYSGDPDALEQLATKLARLEAERDRVKRYNASCRKGAPDVSLLDEGQRFDLARTIRVAAWQCKGGAFPSYHLSNLSGRIKAARDRIADMSARDAS